MRNAFLSRAAHQLAVADVKQTSFYDLIFGGVNLCHVAITQSTVLRSTKHTVKGRIRSEAALRNTIKNESILKIELSEYGVKK